jgi:ADP-ribosylglycohydrolase
VPGNGGSGGQSVPEAIARKFLEWYNAGRLTGVGASTLKALRDLQVGAHWALAGRTGERAAGNGAAMRIAPLAFKVDLTWERHLVRDVANITHKNDEAYAGALAVVVAVQQALGKHWSGENDLLPLVIDLLPDTRVRDRLIELQGLEGKSVREVGKQYGSSGYVVESVPWPVRRRSDQKPAGRGTVRGTVEVGGDTDTVCSMTGRSSAPALDRAFFQSRGWQIRPHARHGTGGAIVGSGSKPAGCTHKPKPVNCQTKPSSHERQTTQQPLHGKRWKASLPNW